MLIGVCVGVGVFVVVYVGGIAVGVGVGVVVIVYVGCDDVVVVVGVAVVIYVDVVGVDVLWCCCYQRCYVGC